MTAVDRKNGQPFYLRHPSWQGGVIPAPSAGTGVGGSERATQRRLFPNFILTSTT
jgi:hypothetical protein